MAIQLPVKWSSGGCQRCVKSVVTVISESVSVVHEKLMLPVQHEN